MTRHRLNTTALAAIVLAAHSAIAPAETIVTTPFRGVTHIQRTETSPRLVVMNIVQIDLSDPSISFFTTPSNGAAPGEFTGQKTSQFVEQYNLQIGLNGDFFSSAGTGPNGEIYRDVTNLAASNGSLISPWPSSPGTIRGAINVSANNVPTLVRPASNSGGTFNTNPALVPYNAIGGSDRMIDNGNIILTSAFANEVHPRSVIGYNATHLFLFTVDGRQAGYSEGMNLHEIAAVLKNDYGVTHALNLDGGGSTTLVFKDPLLRVVNQPSDPGHAERTNGNNFGVYAAVWDQWAVDSNGKWSTASNWTNGVPNGAGKQANFRGAITMPRTVTVNSPVTVGSLNFEHTKTYTITGGSAITLDASTGSAAINVITPATHVITAPLTLADPLTITAQTNTNLGIGGTFNNAAGKAITKNGAGTVTISGPQTYGVGATMTVNAGTLSLSSNAGSPSAANLILNANSTTNFHFTQNLAALVIGPNTTATIGAGANKVVKTRLLSLGSGSKLNVNDNNVIVDYSGTSALGSWNGTSYTGVTGMIQSAYDEGTWTGPGITSSPAAASPILRALAVGEASHVLGISGTQTALWSGQTVDASSVLVKYTLGGDADMNGQLDGDDYFWIDSNIPQSGSVFGYTNGDFDLDGDIDGDDYFILDSNVISPQNVSGAASPGASLSTVPEPLSFLACAFAAALTLPRRRHPSRR